MMDSTRTVNRTHLQPLFGGAVEEDELPTSSPRRALPLSYDSMCNSVPNNTCQQL